MIKYYHLFYWNIFVKIFKRVEKETQIVYNDYICNKLRGEVMLSTILKIATKVLDIAIVWFMFYQLLKYSRNNFKLTLIFKGVLIIVALKLLSDWLSLNTVGIILEYIISWGPLALIIIFQPEIRNVLESIGRSQLLDRHKTLTLDER